MLFLSLSDALVSTSQTERGGEVAIRGFEYQASFGISYLLDKYFSKEEFVFIFEYHDDILVLNSADNPTASEFIQVKTKQNGKWTLASVINSSAKKPVSFVAKLFRHFLSFKAYPIELMFISNAGFDFTDLGRVKAVFLDEQAKLSIIEKVKQQVEGLENVPLEKLEFVTSDLSLLGYSSHLKGKMCEFLDANYGANHGVNASSLTDVFIRLCNDKVRVSSGNIKSFEDLIVKKGITSDFISQVLNKVIATKETQPTWSHAVIFFQDDYGFMELIQLEGIFNRVAVRVGDINSVQYKCYNEVMNMLHFGVAFDFSNRNKSFDDFINMFDTSYVSGADLLDSKEKKIIITYAVVKNALRGASNEK